MKLISSLVTIGILFAGTVAAEDVSDADKVYVYDLASYYEMSIESLEEILERKIAIEDVPVILDVFKRDNTNPKTLADVRASGGEWMDIFRARTQVRADDFYIMIAGDIESETYAPIFAKFKEAPQDNWKQLRLTDGDIVNLANLRCISSQHDYSIFEVMAMRDEEMGFAEINSKIRALKQKMIEEQKKKARP